MIEQHFLIKCPRPLLTHIAAVKDDFIFHPVHHRIDLIIKTGMNLDQSQVAFQLYEQRNIEKGVVLLVYDVFRGSETTITE